MKRALLSTRWRFALIALFVSGALWLFAYSAFWLNPSHHPGLLIRVAWSDTAMTLFSGLVPSVFLGAFELPDSGSLGLVFWDWGCAVLSLLIAFMLILRERIGVVVTAVASGLNAAILLYQLISIWYDGGHVYSISRAVAQWGVLLAALIGYTLLARSLLRLAVRERVISLKRFGPLITIRFLDSKDTQIDPPTRDRIN